jgi:UDP-2,3-diacylglucosamine pyrophosphatase LpxH
MLHPQKFADMERRKVEIIVMSDLHLGTFGCRAKEIVNYLKSIQPGILVLNGDFIDGWQFTKHYFPSSHIQVIKEITGMLSNGVQVVYITGNHDEMLRRYTDVDLGNFKLTDKLVLKINEKTAWIFHGDVFDATTKGAAKLLAKLGGRGYDMLIMLNSCINWCLGLFGMEKMSFSKAIKNSVKKGVAKVGNFEQTAAELAIEKKYDYVICGHIHKPQKRVIETAKGKVLYLNSGDWLENLTSLEYNDGEWGIYTYDEKQFASEPAAGVKGKPPALNVVTDEVQLYTSPIKLPGVSFDIAAFIKKLPDV